MTLINSDKEKTLYNFGKVPLMSEEEVEGWIKDWEKGNIPAALMLILHNQRIVLERLKTLSDKVYEQS